MLSVKQVFELGIKVGIEADPRGAKGIKKYLDRMKNEYDDLKPQDKKYIDPETLTNPFPDSTIHVDNGKTNVKRILAGIDVDAGEILTASQLGERGKKIDLVISHHPKGKALANLHAVLEMQSDIFHSFGVPVHLAEKIMEERISEVGRGVHGINHYQTVNLAQILGVNFINTHTITDNLVNQFINEYLNRKKPDTVRDLMETLMEIPEYQIARRHGAGPKIFSGGLNNRVGKFLVEMTGGTEPSDKVYELFSHSGISTIVGMHMREQSWGSERASLEYYYGHISQTHSA